MNDNEIAEILGSFKAVIDSLTERLDSLTNEINEYRKSFDEKLNGLEKTVYEDILEPAKAAMAEEEKNERFGEFEGRYAEKFAPLMDDVKKIEGEDYNLLRNAFDEYDALEGEKPDEGEYMNTVFDKVMNQINDIREKYGAEKIEIKAEEGGEVEVKADGEDITEEVTGEEKAEEKPEGTEEEVEKVEIAPGNPSMDNPEEIEALMKEFEMSKGA